MGWLLDEKYVLCLQGILFGAGFWRATLLRFGLEATLMKNTNFEHGVYSPKIVQMGMYQNWGVSAEGQHLLWPGLLLGRLDSF